MSLSIVLLYSGVGPSAAVECFTSLLIRSECRF